MLETTRRFFAPPTRYARAMPLRRIPPPLRGVGLLAVLLLAVASFGGAAADATASACYAIPNGTIRVSIPPGIYVPSSQIDWEAKRGYTPHFVPLICSRPSVVAFAPRYREPVSPRGRLEASEISWTKWGLGGAVGSAMIETCPGGCRIRGMVALSRRLRVRARNGWITLFTRVTTRGLHDPRAHDDLLLAPTPGRALENTRVGKRELAEIRATLLADKSTGNWEQFPIIGITGRRSIFDPGVVLAYIKVRKLEGPHVLTWRANGHWRVYDIGTDLACSAVWPDDLLAYCNPQLPANERSRTQAG